MSVFINDMAVFMPNEPVHNEDIETVLGKVDDQASRSKRIVLKTNGIKRRFYAIDRQTGQLSHSNAQLSAEAVRRLKPYEDFDPSHIQCLCCGTTSPDVLFPGHALMVQGELGLPPGEAVTTAGICLCGMIAFKYAYMNIAAGMSENAVAVASELSSSFLRSQFFASSGNKAGNGSKAGVLPFDTDFLRWMLSDGAGAAFLSQKPNPDRISLRVDWIDHIGYAGQLEACMYAGGLKIPDGSLTGWRQLNHHTDGELRHIMAVKQDVRLLDRQIIETMQRALVVSIGKHGLKPDAIDWFLPHYSSAYFREKVFQGLREIDFEIGYERWFTNIETMGNTGSASIYIILAELMHSGKIREGDQLLCFIPESGRFSHCFMHLSAVGPKADRQEQIR
jgi:3-oxoacyl-[acyl-carrier-protein] synthase-3